MAIMPVMISECIQYAREHKASTADHLHDVITDDIQTACDEIANTKTLSAVQKLKLDLDDLFAQLKDEMRMEMLFTHGQKPNDIPAPKTPSIKIDRKMAPVNVGYPAISQQVSFESTRNNCSTKLEDNEIFKLVNRSLARNQRGEASYNIEDLITARGDRFDDEARATLRATNTEYKVEHDSEDSDEDSRWEAILKSKGC